MKLDLDAIEHRFVEINAAGEQCVISIFYLLAFAKS